MRAFLRAAGVIVVLFVVAGVAAANDYFPQSVASGDPRPDSVVLWTRVDSPTDEEPKALLLEVATDVTMSLPPVSCRHGPTTTTV
jgi:phosphodiesterase/alkaline phosphatase D-like protein